MTICAPASRREPLAFTSVLAGACLLRLALIFVPAAKTIDLAIFIRWLHFLRDHGLALAYVDSGIDYPPAMLYLLAGIDGLASLLPASLQQSDAVRAGLMRLVPALADCGTVGLIAYALRGVPPQRRLAACAMIGFNPALLYVAAFWTQFDAIYTFQMVAALLLFSSGRLKPAWVVYTLALATKPQAIALAPLMVLATVHRVGLRGMLGPLAASGLAVLALLGPWLAAGQLASVVRAVTEVEPRIDVSAFNLWYLVRGGVVHDAASTLKLPFLSVSYALAGSLLVVISAIAIGVLLWRQRVRPLALGAALLSLALFLFAPGVHERFLYPVLPITMLSAAGWDEQRTTTPATARWGWPAIGLLTLTFGINLAAVASFAPQLWTNLFVLSPPYTAFRAALVALALLAAASNLGVFGYGLFTLAREPLPSPDALVKVS
jgi:Gpi18-like mannosyltransferase